VAHTDRCWPLEPPASGADWRSAGDSQIIDTNFSLRLPKWRRFGALCSRPRATIANQMLAVKSSAHEPRLLHVTDWPPTGTVNHLTIRTFNHLTIWLLGANRCSPAELRCARRLAENARTQLEGGGTLDVTGASVNVLAVWGPCGPAEEKQRGRVNRDRERDDHELRRAEKKERGRSVLLLFPARLGPPCSGLAASVLGASICSCSPAEFQRQYHIERAIHLFIHL